MGFKSLGKYLTRAEDGSRSRGMRAFHCLWTTCGTLCILSTGDESLFGYLWAKDDRMAINLIFSMNNLILSSSIKEGPVAWRFSGSSFLGLGESSL